MHQNFPNPGNPTTVIRYALPQSDYVLMEVYDVVGRKVYTLVDEVKEAGEHSIRFEATNLASGVYLYRMKTGEKTLSRKMMVIR